MNIKDSNNNVKSNFTISSIPYNLNSKSLIPTDLGKSLLNKLPICSGCTKPIIDQYLHNILDKYWHIQCLRCADCDKQLSGRCFERDGKLFCANDYKRRVCTKCSLCLNIILPNELVRHSRDSSVFHLKCFFCVVCHKQLSTGDEYCLLENYRPVCKEDFQNIFKEISEMTVHGCKNNLSKIDGDTIKEEGSINCQKEFLNNSINVTKDIETFKDEDFNPPNCTITTNTLVKQNNKYSFSDIPSFQPQNNQRGSNDIAHNSCLESKNIRPSITELINNNEGIFSDQHSIIIEEAQLCDNARSICDNQQMETQLLTPEQNEKVPKIVNSYEKENELCSLEDDLKSSFSAASSPESIIKEDEQDGNDGNMSDQTFRDDQHSICHTESREGAQSGNSGTKRRGPRTTIKAKQLDTLKAAFAATPKPTRHVREQLAQDTGLTMRVIQVWFQNRRSKERRMKQLSAMGARRPFFRNARRMRSLSRGFGPDDIGGDGGQMMNNPPYHGYFGENPEFCNAIAALGGSFPSADNYPLGHPAIHREFFMSNSNSGLQPSFLTLNQPTSLQSSIQLPSSEGNQSILVSGQLENNFNPNDHFSSTNCTSPEVQFSQQNFNSMSPHNLLPRPGYLCGPQITSTGISRPQSIQNLSSLNFVQAPMVGMESW